MIEQLTETLRDRYAIEREIGQGGMATVYLARDLKHDRQVAIKVVHPDLAAVLGAERFLAEIHVTAKLQHPHILPLFDSGVAEHQLWYVMPYVEGESLRDRLSREGELPVDESIRIARDVGSALDYAHRHGVVHRDIKPENILLQHGTALVADFGIALAVSNAGGTRLTQTGLSLGTPQYMSPEQASGAKNIDGRTDIYSLGCVLYEMLAGEAPFTGPNAQSIVARVLTENARPIRARRATVPPALEAATLTAIAKLPADRFATAADFIRALDERSSTTTNFAAPQSRPAQPAALTYAPWLLAGAAMLLAGVMLVRSPAPLPVTVSTILPPEGQAFGEGASFGSLSTDGRRFAFTALNPKGESQLWIRRLDTLLAQAVPATTGARAPFFSSDGAMVGFFNGDALYVAEVSGGAPRSVCTAPGSVSGAWGRGGVIVIIARDGIFRANASGGACQLAIKQDTASQNFQHASVLADGRHVLFSNGVAVSTIHIGDLESGTVRAIVEHAQDATFVEPDIIVYGRQSDDASNTRLWAQRFDLRRDTLAGNAIPISSDVRTAANVYAYSVSPSGDLVYLPGRPDLGEVLTDRNGRVQDTASVRGTWTFRYASEHPWLADAGLGLFVYDIARRVSQPIKATVPPMGPIWSPHDTAIAYMTCDASFIRCGLSTVSMADRHETMLITQSEQSVWPSAWSADGRYLVVTRGREFLYRRGEIWLYEFSSKRFTPLVAERFSVAEGALSPDGRWLAYRSDETGSLEVWIRPFRGSGAPRRVSTGGGRQPRWSANGRELFFQSPAGHVMVVDVATGNELSLGTPRLLFIAPEWTPQTFSDDWATSFDVSGDGQRFAFRMNAATNSAVLVQHWTPLLPERSWWKRIF